MAVSCGSGPAHHGVHGAVPLGQRVPLRLDKSDTVWGLTVDVVPSAVSCSFAKGVWGAWAMAVADVDSGQPTLAQCA